MAARLVAFAPNVDLQSLQPRPPKGTLMLRKFLVKTMHTRAPISGIERTSKLQPLPQSLVESLLIGRGQLANDFDNQPFFDRCNLSFYSTSDIRGRRNASPKD
jgi:hypothetical protein